MKKITITILTLALIITAFASCTKTETETTTYEPVIEFSTEEITSEEVTTETPSTMQEETTTEVPSTEEVTTEAPATEVPTTQAPETNTKPPETTTKVPETTTKVPETTTNEPIKEVASPDFSLKDEPEDDISWMNGPTSEKRAGLIYDKTGRLSSYNKIPEGSKYYEYDENGNRQLKEKPYSPGNDPGPDRCEYCNKETKPYDGKHYGCYYGYCDRFMRDMNCPECKEFVKANTCHSCKK